MTTTLKPWSKLAELEVDLAQLSASLSTSSQSLTSIEAKLDHIDIALFHLAQFVGAPDVHHTSIPASGTLANRVLKLEHVLETLMAVKTRRWAHL